MCNGGIKRNAGVVCESRDTEEEMKEFEKIPDTYAIISS